MSDTSQPTTNKLGGSYGGAKLRFKCPNCGMAYDGLETENTCKNCHTTFDLEGKGILALARVYSRKFDQPPLSLSLQIIPEGEKASIFKQKKYSYGGVGVNQRVNVILPMGKYYFPNGKRSMHFEITPENPIFYATFCTPNFAEASVSDMPEENRIPMYDD